jgi:hypothetical protein
MTHVVTASVRKPTIHPATIRRVFQVNRHITRSKNIAKFVPSVCTNTVKYLITYSTKPAVQTLRPGCTGFSCSSYVDESRPHVIRLTGDVCVSRQRTPVSRVRRVRKPARQSARAGCCRELTAQAETFFITGGYKTRQRSTSTNSATR